MTNETKTLRDVALSFSTQKTTAMVKKIEESFERRDAFERDNGLSLETASSYTKARDAVIKSKIAVARLFLAIGVEPANVIERKVVSNAMFNAKALHKLVEIAQYVSGTKSRIQKVTKAFIACAVIMTRRGHDVIDNKVNRRFLNSSDFDSLISDAETREELQKQRHVVMTGGAPTQSSQVRNVLDVLGFGEIRSSERARDSIALDMSHEFYDMFARDYLTA